jgi:hypothetical protein
MLFLKLEQSMYDYFQRMVILLQRGKHMETSAQSAGEQKVSTRPQLACGAIGLLLNIVVLLILGAIRPGYNTLLIPDSSLELGVGGWIQISNYLARIGIIVSECWVALLAIRLMYKKDSRA